MALHAQFRCESNDLYQLTHQNQRLCLVPIQRQLKLATIIIMTYVIGM